MEAASVYEEARATVSREVCGNQRYLLGCRQAQSPCSLPGLDQGDARESDTVYWGDAKAKLSLALEYLGLWLGNLGPLRTGKKH